MYTNYQTHDAASDHPVANLPAPPGQLTVSPSQPARATRIFNLKTTGWSSADDAASDHPIANLPAASGCFTESQLADSRHYAAGESGPIPGM